MIAKPSLPRMKSFVPSIGSTSHSRGAENELGSGGTSSEMIASF